MIHQFSWRSALRLRIKHQLADGLAQTVFFGKVFGLESGSAARRLHAQRRLLAIQLEHVPVPALWWILQDHQFIPCISRT